MIKSHKGFYQVELAIVSLLDQSSFATRSGTRSDARMTQQTQTVEKAVSLMRMALALLDRVNERCAALHLQHALDVATDQPLLQPGEEIDPDLIKRILGPNRLH